MTSLLQDGENFDFSSSFTSHPITVLLIDDQPIIAEAIRRMLVTEEDIIFHYISDPTQTLKAAAELSPTVILQDLVMPDLDGLTLVRFLRAKDAITRDIPLIVLSSKEDPQIKAAAFAFGANDYLVKLPDKLEMIARIRYHSRAYINLLQRNEAYKTLQNYLGKLKIEQQKSEDLLLNILPKQIAERLKEGQSTIADSFPNVSVLFADIVGFSKLATRVSPTQLVGMMNEVFSAFDYLADYYQLEKIKTIGDAYMVVAGLPVERSDHADAIANIALDMQSSIETINKNSSETFRIRIGINSGPVVAGVIGKKKFLYDLWGDTVNTASRMESHGLPGRIHVTQFTYELLEDKYVFEPRGEIEVKGKGKMSTYFLIDRK
ncbi:adenylate/guanylate cyclase domain-containing protein [[Phormidium] sp. ETS-05]|uniref:adenylate/guanylate cyclase domain-containing protein n=1 Tax=[Phormidium] sp. ETS-05 TaxID=222819 RepID=UPI0018EF3186|nr:adenylate/guanylate cyclase domain-containing protein [[Phormidium] sp. ETS-05]